VGDFLGYFAVLGWKMEKKEMKTGERKRRKKGRYIYYRRLGAFLGFLLSWGWNTWVLDNTRRIGLSGILDNKTFGGPATAWFSIVRIGVWMFEWLIPHKR
jgi:hypothetical protein